ncbi:hypothetical protein PybrP1_006628 [[Pythium] brassicae (nom. inval.)]|nr:hypothetical protein PybrP1_006628 [[Pythium] brassicae (nom. inval.)]
MHHHALVQLATNALGSLVRECFGPSAAGETLLFAPPDPPLVTADGHAILMQWRRGLRESRRAPEPVQLFMLAAADALHLREGDGLGDAFGDLRREIDAFLRDSEQRGSDAKMSAQLLFQRAQSFLARATDRIVFAQAVSVFGSHALQADEFILCKSLVPAQLPQSLATISRGPVRFVCLACALSLATGANHVTMRTFTDDALFAAADATRGFVARFLATLRSAHDVRLIVCTEQIDDSAAAVCTRLGIACVQFAERADVSDLCSAAAVSPLASLFDEIRASEHVGVCGDGVAVVRLQQSGSLWFRGLSLDTTSNSGTVVVPQLLLKAPTRGVYKQYYKAVVRALRILRSWWKPSDTGFHAADRQQPQVALYCCRGGGATELAIARHLDATAPSKPTEAARLARAVFADSLRDVVAVLHSNLAASMGVAPSDIRSSDSVCAAGGMRRLLQDMARVALAHAADGTALPPVHGYVLDTTHTVATLDGPLPVPELVFADPQALGLLHPWQRVDALLAAALQTLEQLFRVDGVLHSTATTRMTGAARA